MTPECLERLGAELVKNDREVGDQEIRSTQRKMNGHARSLAKIFQIGSAKGEDNQQRCWDNISSEALTLDESWSENT